jgi:hypothetical protein
MSRKLKVLGTALVAVLALGAVASAAQAHVFKTFGATSAILTAEADATNGTQTFTTAGGTPVTCTGIKINPGATVANNATSVTAHPEYTGCKIGGVVNTSVTTTGCNYVFSGTTNANGDAAVTIECEGTKEITIGPTLGCSVKVPGQVVTGVHYNNIQTGAASTEMHLTLETTVSAIGYSTSGCSSLTGESDGSHTGATYTGNATIKGFTDNNGVEEAAQVGVTVE